MGLARIGSSSGMAQSGFTQPASGAGLAVSSGVTGDDYHVELSYALWRPSRELLISSESLGIVG